MYGGDWVYPGSNYSYQLGYFHNLPGGASNGGREYTASRQGTARAWGVVRGSAAADRKFAQAWLLRTRLNLQYTHEPLIPGEQIGFGGADSLRGFDERLVAADSGADLSIEVWTPPLWQGVTLLGFVDTAYGTR